MNNLSVSVLFRRELRLYAMRLHVCVEVLFYSLCKLLQVMIANFQILVELVYQTEVRKASVLEPLVHKREIFVRITPDIDHTNTTRIFLELPACIDKLLRQAFHFVPHVPLRHCVCWCRIWNHYQKQFILLLIFICFHKLCELT